MYIFHTPWKDISLNIWQIIFRSSTNLWILIETSLNFREKKTLHLERKILESSERTSKSSEKSQNPLRKPKLFNPNTLWYVSLCPKKINNTTFSLFRNFFIIINPCHKSMNCQTKNIWIFRYLKYSLNSLRKTCPLERNRAKIKKAPALSEESLVNTIIASLPLLFAQADIDVGATLTMCT